MTREDFEALRAMPGKVIAEDIRFIQKTAMKPTVTTDRLPVLSAAGDLVAFLTINYNPRVDSISFSAFLQPDGPICRLDVRGSRHGDAGRTHKHELRRPSCHGRNLPFAEPHPDIEELGVQEAFDRFCEMAHIQHTGVFTAPNEEDEP